MWSRLFQLNFFRIHNDRFRSGEQGLIVVVFVVRGTESHRVYNINVVRLTHVQQIATHHDVAHPIVGFDFYRDVPRVEKTEILTAVRRKLETRI